MLLFAFGQGITESQIKAQRGLGDNIAIIWPGVTSKEFRGLPTGRRIRFTEDDARLIRSKSTTLKGISPEYRGWNVNLRYKKQNTLRSVSGVWPEFTDLRNVIPAVGSRFINQRDMDEKRRVIFLGNKLAEDLFEQEEAIGESILFNGTPFTVIGVMKEKKQNSSYNGRDNRNAFIPSTTFKAMFSRRYVNVMIIQAHPTASMEATKNEVYEIMGERYKFDPSDKEAFSIWDTTKGIAFLKTFFMAFQYFLFGIGVATLITGGIGVSNIMNVVLEERTKEIGIKMALGAKKQMILLQFVLETLLITAVGGILGFVFAHALIQVFPYFELEEFIGTPRINMLGSIMVVVVLGLVGLASGYFPARRAANLQPVQALKLF